MQHVDLRRPAITMTICAAILLGISFIAWGELRQTGGGDFFPSGMTITMTGWNGNVSLLDIEFPNALVFIVAAIAALVGWLTASAMWIAPGILLLALATYPVAHLGFLTFVLVGADNGSVSAGTLIGVVTGCGLLFGAIQIVSGAGKPRSVG